MHVDCWYLFNATEVVNDEFMNGNCLVMDIEYNTFNFVMKLKSLILNKFF